MLAWNWRRFVVFIVNFEHNITFIILLMTYEYADTLSANHAKGQTHSNNSSAIPRGILWVYLTILWDWHLKG